MELTGKAQKAGEVIKGLSICKKHGEYVAYFSKKGPSECPSCAEDEANIDRLLRQRCQNKQISEAKIRETFKRSSVPPLFKEVTFKSYIPSCTRAEEILSSLKRYSDGFDEFSKSGASILMHGTSGTGKTMLGAALLNSIMNNGYTALYIECPSAISWIKRSWVRNPEVSQDEQIEKFIEPDILMIDDLPKGCNRETERQMIWSIINSRVMNLKPTITTSPMDNNQLEKRLHKEVVRRLSFRGKSFLFSWDSYEEIGLLG
jgi:DNA replication protein DnaC